MSTDRERASLLLSPYFLSITQQNPAKLQCKYGHETQSNCDLGFVCLVWGFFWFVSGRKSILMGENTGMDKAPQLLIFSILWK